MASVVVFGVAIVPATSAPSWTELHTGAKELQVAIRSGVTNRSIEVRTADIYILGMFWRAVRLYDGVLLLLEAALPEEAAILGRSLFEESLRLRQLEEDTAQRYALVLGWANHSITEKIGLIREAHRLGLENDLAPIEAELESQRAKLERHRNLHNVGKYSNFAPVRTSAMRFGRSDDYWTYAWSHESVHGSDAAWMFGRNKVDAETVGPYDRTKNPNLMTGICAYAAKSVIDSRDAVAAIFGWPTPTRATELALWLQQVAEARAEAGLARTRDNVG